MIYSITSRQLSSVFGFENYVGLQFGISCAPSNTVLTLWLLELSLSTSNTDLIMHATMNNTIQSSL